MSIKTIEAARVAGKNGFSLISDETFRKLYAALLQCRMLDERLRTVTGYEPWRGREACTAGVATCLRFGDSIAPTARGVLAGYFQSGKLPCLRGTFDETQTQLRGANGEAQRHKREKSGNVSVVFAGAGEPDRMREVFAVAASRFLPVIYVLEGDLPLSHVGRKIPVIRVDGCDPVAAYRVAHESIARAREGVGPTIMECAAWPGDREPADPLVRLERYLSGKQLFRQDWKRRLQQKYQASLDEVVKPSLIEL
jgi:TPP-dependent pyruvate/acetoin dehydrogenase alpha subunit